MYTYTHIYIYVHIDIYMHISKSDFQCGLSCEKKRDKEREMDLES